MKKQPLYLQKVRVKNFKAIRDSGVVRLTPLTVFVGNNGVGKSSLVEALETIHLAADDLANGAEKAMRRWNGIEHITNKYSKPKIDSTAPIEIDLVGYLSILEPGDVSNSPALSATLASRFQAKRNLSDPTWDREWRFRDHSSAKESKSEMTAGQVDDVSATQTEDSDLGSQIRRHNERLFRLKKEVDVFRRKAFAERVIATRWQFLLANPDMMGQLVLAQSSGNHASLSRDGGNIAAYLRGMYETDPSSFESLLDAMRMVVPYAKSIQHEQTGELVRNDYITLTEGNFKIPGWLISTGTLRVLAILACLHHPLPPKLLVIEELENGLDPRTLGLVLAGIRDAVESGRTQVIITTHSPYLLDQVPLEYIVTVERQDGHPVFKRPADDESLQGWREDFTNGQLFTMGTLWGRG